MGKTIKAIWMERFQARLAAAKIPDYMKGAVERWVLHGLLPGDFLTAVLCNDLKEAIGRADETNQRCLPEYVGFLYNHTPMGCWGSTENFKSWASKGGLAGHGDQDDE